MPAWIPPSWSCARTWARRSMRRRRRPTDRLSTCCRPTRRCCSCGRNSSVAASSEASGTIERACYSVSGMDLTLCHLYPDLLNLYGDRGNLMTLAHRAQWRGIAVRIEERRLGDPVVPGAYDLYFIGGGEDRQQRLAADDLRAVKGAALREAAASGAVVLAVCGGYQLLGHYYRPSDGEDLIGLGLLDLTTEHPGPAARRLIGNIVIRSPYLGGATLVGFENHGGGEGPRRPPRGPPAGVGGGGG